MKIKGIDVSGYNQVASYDKVRDAGVEFGIIKIIRKDLSPDKLFERHWAGFESAGIPVQGVYNYSYATSINKFISDAHRVLGVLAGRKTMVWLDIEDSCQANMGKALADGIKAYADVIAAAGLPFGVYTGLSFFNSFLKPYISQLPYPFWIARYPSSYSMDIKQSPRDTYRPAIAPELYGWQYSSKGQIPGIVGNVDLNEWYVDIEAKAQVPEESKRSYAEAGFDVDMRKHLGLSEFATRTDILRATDTISTTTNKNHECVTALERLLKEHGYYTGVVEADIGKTPCYGGGMAKATILFQSRIVGLKRPDAIWSGKTGASYKKALRL